MPIPIREFVLSQKSEELVASADEPFPNGMYAAASEAHPVPPEETESGEVRLSEPRDSTPMLAFVAKRFVLLAVVAKKLVGGGIGGRCIRRDQARRGSDGEAETSAAE